MMVTVNAAGASPSSPGTTAAASSSSNSNSTAQQQHHPQHNNSVSSQSRSMVAKGTHPLTQRRRRIGKGALSHNTTAAGGGYKSAGGVINNNSNNSSGNSSTSSSSESATPLSATGPTKGTSTPSTADNMDTASTSSRNLPQHTSTAPAAATTGVAASLQPPKTCHSARMAMVCCQGSIRMGARAQLGLCPPGRPRRTLQAALRQRTRASTSSSSSSTKQAPHTSNSITRRLEVPSASTDSYYTLERMIGPQSLEDYEDQEEDYLLSTNTFDVESDEEASSGDDDELGPMDPLLAPEIPALDNLSTKYRNLREPLFTPAGTDPNQNPNGAPVMMTSGASGKLPFNRRKIRYFDAITAHDRLAARAYLTQEAQKARRRNAVLLTRHLRRMQKQERRKRRERKGETVPENDSDSENENPKETALIQGGISQFDQPMTSGMSAALILESLTLNPVESIEGMAKCYDGIVSAGVALIEAQNQDEEPEQQQQREGNGIPKTSRANVLEALAPLLITSLEQPSGDVIVLLARMRRMCGTARYQRRFVQRIAPCLVRPKNAAVWCLRHQHDMEPIVAAVELILDTAHDIFGSGWYEKGRLLLADTKRAESLNSAATQLRNLSGEPAADALSLGLAYSHHGSHHGLRRYSSAVSQKDHGKANNDQLAKWEIMAVDKEIHSTISKIMSSDWSKVTLNTKDSDSVRSIRRSVSSSKRPSTLPHSSSGEASPRAMISPRSPGPPLGGKMPLSPPPSKDYSSTGPSADSVFDNIMPATPQPAERPTSPEGVSVQKSTSPMVTSPPATKPSSSMDEEDIKSAAASTSFTPPRSPKSSLRGGVEQAPPLPKPSSSNDPFLPISPRRERSTSPSLGQNANQDTRENVLAPFTTTLGTSPAAPLSPSSSLGNSTTSDLLGYRPSSGSSIISTGSGGASQSAHYRQLTSTASERKRTVAACRALRAQITRFEEQFIMIHGRPPKGAAERAPLATTYSQYRDWKRAIRADAACRIQALFRGARTRWILTRGDNKQISRIVQSRASRKPYIRQPSATSPRRQANQDTLLNQIGIPVEIGEGDQSRTSALRPSFTSSISARPQPPTPETFPGQQTNPSLAPQWASQVVSRRAESRDRTPDGFPIVSSGSRSPAAPSSPSHSTAANSVSATLNRLQARKRELKQDLKKYDMDFARKHGRMPVKAEKEPIRHLYESYNALKSQITAFEQETARASSTTPPVQQLSAPAPIAPPPSSRIISAPPTPPDSSDSDRSIDSPGLIGGRVRRQHQPGRSPPVSASASSVGESQDLAALKAEKAQLHQMLRSYEKDFFKKHQRQVSSFADIKPVASQYRRYKEIKKAITALLNQLQQGRSQG